MQELKELMLRDPRYTLAVAESITSGRIQAKIGLISGASDFFLGGITVYNLEQKAKHLGVPREIAEPVNCISQEVVELMAQGACRLFGSTLSLATTGYAEPAPERNVKYPFAWWALAHDLGDGRMALQSGMVECPGSNRMTAQEAVAMSALGALKRYLRQARGIS